MRMEAIGPQPAIGLANFVALADRTYHPDRPGSAWELRHALIGLAGDPTWLLSLILERQTSRMNSAWAREQPSYFILHTSTHFALRANVWLPERRNSSMDILENAAFSYDYPHDHNFDILTATCIGPGYDTDAYEYGDIPADVAVGDHIPVKPLGRHRLVPNTVFFYEACRDVHTQLPVEDITVTLNFLPLRKTNYARPQLIFECVDPHTLKVMGVPLSPEGRQMSAMRILTKLAEGRPEIASGMESVANAHANPRVSDYAARLRDLVGMDSSAVHSGIVKEIDEGNVALKYHEVAKVARAGR